MLCGKNFTTLDLSQAFTHILLDDASTGYVTIRVYTFVLWCSLSSCCISEVNGNLLSGIPNVVSYLDDTFVTGKDYAEYLTTLKAVFNWLQQFGLRLKLPKYRFLQQLFEYRDHFIDAKCLHAKPTKVKALIEAPAPQDITELRAFLGLLNYYSMFLLNRPHQIHPLKNLLSKGQK